MNGHNVFLMEKGNSIMGKSDIPEMNRKMLIDLLIFYGVNITTQVQILEFKNNNIIYRDYSGIHTLGVDDAISAIGYYSDNSLYQNLLGIENEVYILGDARKVKNIMYAIWDAYEVANSI